MASTQKTPNFCVPWRRKQFPPSSNPTPSNKGIHLHPESGNAVFYCLCEEILLFCQYILFCLSWRSDILRCPDSRRFGGLFLCRMGYCCAGHPGWKVIWKGPFARLDEPENKPVHSQFLLHAAGSSYRSKLPVLPLATDFYHSFSDDFYLLTV